MKNWIKAFLIAAISISVIAILVIFVPYIWTGIMIVAWFSAITFLIKTILDEHGRKDN